MTTKKNTISYYNTSQILGQSIWMNTQPKYEWTPGSQLNEHPPKKLAHKPIQFEQPKLQVSGVLAKR